MAEGIPDYDELKVRIDPHEPGKYRVLAFAPDGSTGQTTFTLPISATELENFVLKVGLPKSRFRSTQSSRLELPKRFGEALFTALIKGDVHDVYRAARRTAEERDRGLRVTLYLGGVPELMAVPWEFLYEQPIFLSQSIYTPVVRSLDLKDVRPPAKLRLPVHVLGMVSRPHGYDNLDVEEERHKLDTALGASKSQGLVELRWLESANLSALERAIGAPDEVHVLHYIGHGRYDESTGDGSLILEDRHRNPHHVTGEELGPLLYDERSLRLVVLNACEGARTSNVDPFSGVAAGLVKFGVPAVIGMQFEITDEAAITFSDRLYTALAQGYPVDAAVAQARKAIFAAGNQGEFATPVLFLRSSDARLFAVEDEVVPRHGREAAGSVADFMLQLRQDSTTPGPSNRLSWRLIIENTGSCRLTNVVARQADNTSLAAPVDLRPGGRHVIRWSDARQAGHDRLITVSARGDNGARVSEQIVAHAATSAATETSKLSASAPTTPITPSREGPSSESSLADAGEQVRSGPTFRPATDAPLTPAEIEALGTSGWKTARVVFQKELEDDENVYAAICAYQKQRDEELERGLLALTDRRLAFTKHDGTLLAWALGEVADAAVTFGWVNHTLAVRLQDGDKLEFIAGGHKSAAELIDRLLREAVEQASDASGRDDGAPGADAPLVEVIERGDKICTLRVRFSEDAYTVKYKYGSLRDTVEVNGTVLHQIWLPNEQGYELVLADRDRPVNALLKVATNTWGRIRNVRLVVAGQVAYSED